MLPLHRAPTLTKATRSCCGVKIDVFKTEPNKLFLKYRRVPRGDVGFVLPQSNPN